MIEHILLITVAVLISQFRVMTYGYVSDDIPVYQNPPKTKNRWHRGYLWLIGAYRWKPKYDHVLTMIIHILVCWVMYFAFGANQTAFYATLLFSIHPGNLHGSVWISGRAYPLVAVFVLGAMVIPLASPIFLWASAYFTVGFLPPLALIGSPSWYAVLIMPLVWLYWRKKFKKAVINKASTERATEDKVIHPRKIILCIKTIGFYLSLAIFPHKICFYHNFLQSCAGSQRRKAYTYCIYYWIGLISILAWIVYSAYRWDMISYGMLWFFVTIFPYSNIYRVQQEISERYLYIPLIGVMVAMAHALAPYPWAFLVLLGFYYGRFHSTVLAFRDDFWVVEQSVMDDPFAWFGWHMRALKRWNAHSYHEAMVFWTMARNESPREFKLLFNLAVVFKAINKHQESKQFLEEAEKNIVPGQEKQVEGLIRAFKDGKPVGMIY
ncbi:MAG: hypothetical protein CMB80_02985 [Flammeovirgaceae bacterium]|nr:hypothetical protein [Flammeovirgaceae bacterium]